jgi:hypothetical protein
VFKAIVFSTFILATASVPTFGENTSLANELSADHISVEVQPCDLACRIAIVFSPYVILVKNDNKVIGKAILSRDARRGDETSTLIELSRIVLFARQNHLPILLETDADLNISKFVAADHSQNSVISHVDLRQLPLSKDQINFSLDVHHWCDGRMCSHGHYGYDIQTLSGGLTIAVSKITEFESGTYTKMGSLKFDIRPTFENYRAQILTPLESSVTKSGILKVEGREYGNCSGPYIGTQNFPVCESKELLSTNAYRGDVSLIPL